MHGSIDMIRYTKNDVVDGALIYTGYLYFKPETRDEMHYPARIEVTTGKVLQTPPNTILPMFITGMDKLKRLLGDEMYSVLMEQMLSQFGTPADALIIGYSYSDEHINEALKKTPKASSIRNINPSVAFPFDDFKNVKNFKTMEADGALD